MNGYYKFREVREIGILDRLKKIGKTEKRSDSFGGLETLFGGVGSRKFSSPGSTFDNIGVVYACVERRANAFAKLPLQSFKKNKSGRERDHNRIDYLLTRRPNSYQTPFVFKQQIEVSKLLWGNAYIKLNISKKGEVESLEHLDPAKTTLVKEKGEYWYRTNIDNQQVLLGEDEVMHFPHISQDGKKGKSPLTVAREEIESLSNMKGFEKNFYEKGTMRKGALVVPAQLGTEAKIKLKQEWANLYGGSQNAGDIAVLDAGLEWKDISLPLKDAEFISSRRFTTTEIANIFNVPEFLLNNMERATFNNIEHQNMRFILEVIQPDCILVEEEMNFKIYGEDTSRYVKFNLTSSLRGDSKTRVEYYKEMLSMGVFSINDVRALEEENSIGELGDKHYFSLNFTTLETLEQHSRIKTEDKENKKDEETEDEEDKDKEEEEIDDKKDEEIGENEEENKENKGKKK